MGQGKETSIRSSLTIPNRLQYLEPANAYLRELARASGFEEKDITLFQLAVEEAVINVIKHGYPKDTLDTFEILFENFPGGLAVIIKSKGIPFDPSSVSGYNPDFSEKDVKSATAGLGTHLMRQSVDDISFENFGRDGRQIRMEKYLPSARIDKLISNKTAAPVNKEKPGDFDPKNLHYEIRRLKPDEGIEISRCAYEAYGYSYEDYIYYPERVMEMNRNGILYSLVAASDEFGIMGHLAFKFRDENDLTPEIGIAFVRPHFRGAKIFQKLNTRIFSDAEEMNINGVFARAVTSHIISQKTSMKYDFKSCGIKLALFPDDVDFKGLSGKIQQKESGLILYKVFKKDEDKIIFPPEKHREIVKEIYSNIGLNVTCSTPAEGQSEVESILTSGKVNILNIAYIKIKSYGSDILTEVKAKLRMFCLEKIDAIYLYLNLEDPLTPAMTEEFEKLGFFFSAVHPGAVENKDALVLQYLNNIKIDYKKIKLVDPFAQKILSYVENEDPYMEVSS